jgi:hypothetical protein
MHTTTLSPQSSRTQATINAEEDVGKMNLDTLVVGM